MSILFVLEAWWIGLDWIPRQMEAVLKQEIYYIKQLIEKQTYAELQQKIALQGSRSDYITLSFLEDLLINQDPCLRCRKLSASG